MASNHAFRRIKDLVVYRQTNRPLSDQEWGAFLNVLTSGDGIQNLRVLVVTDGAGPNSDQRRRLKETLGNSKPKASIVTDSVATRFVVSSIAFITPNIRAFTKNEMNEAYEHLGLDPVTRKLAERTLSELSESLGVAGHWPAKG
ncbi:MAG: hypothetical protein GX607_08220 [Myxococcales bacterium]|nr:hypothetical protein [Myxococcales bacterium]